MVANVWVKLGIFRCRRKVGWRSVVMAPQDTGQANGSLLRWTREAVNFTYYVSICFSLPDES